jgi:hypothetical protein
MKMWIRKNSSAVGWQRKHKSDFGGTNPIRPQAQETKTHLSAMTIYFRKKPISASGLLAGFMHFAKQNQHERQELNVGSRLEPSLSTSRKVILPNKANFRGLL